MTHAEHQRKADMRAWLAQNSHHFRYAATLTLTHPYASASGAASVARRFHHKFNKAVWGGRRCHTHRIAWAAVVHGDEFQRFHVHAAVGNIPQPLHFFPALQRFKQTVKHTEGVWQQMDFWPIEADPADWVNYMTRVLRDGTDCALLVDDMDLGTAQPN
jgi:hypothetical protein